MKATVACSQKALHMLWFFLFERLCDFTDLKKKKEKNQERLLFLAASSKTDCGKNAA